MNLEDTIYAAQVDLEKPKMNLFIAPCVSVSSKEGP